MQFDARIPAGKLVDKWNNRKYENKLVSPANKRKYEIIIVGTGLAGASAAATLGELGYNVKLFCIQDSPRRAHSIAAQGGINAAKNYQNDGDSVFRLFYDTIKGGDFRAREANVYRLAEVANNIIDQCVAQGIPFAREYGGTLANRSFGGAQVSRTFYARGQTGQQLLLGAYSAMMRQVAAGKVTLYPRREMMELIVVNDRATGIICRNLISGQLERYSGHSVVLATGGYANAFCLSTNAMACNVSAIWRAYRRGAGFANPGFVQIHPTCIPVHGDYQSKLTLMSESLRNDGRIWVPGKKGDTRIPADIPENERDYFLERKYPGFGNLVPRDVASRNIKEVCDAGHGTGETGLAVYLDFADAIKRDGIDVIQKKYGNLFHMYEKITDHNPTKEPMTIYPAVHYTMGGLWVDYNLMSNIPGLFVIGEANFSDHGANRLGASALMQGLADGYFILPHTMGNYLAQTDTCDLSTELEPYNQADQSIKNRTELLLKNNASNKQGMHSVAYYHRQLGEILWDNCGIIRNREGLTSGLQKIPELREEFWNNVRVPGKNQQLNQSLERAGRVADYLEFSEIIVKDALAREESCGCHLREESQSKEHEAKRNDEQYSHVSIWEYAGENKEPVLHKEKLTFNEVTPSQRSYK